MNFYTPTKAHALLTGFVAILAGMGRTVIRGYDLKLFNDAVQAEEAVLELPPTKSTCRELEKHLGVMANLLLDAPLLETKPQHQVKVLVDTIEMVGTALSIAAGTWDATDTGVLH